jgi:hypothetical protein
MPRAWWTAWAARPDDESTTDAPEGGAVTMTAPPAPHGSGRVAYYTCDPKES